MRSEMCDELKPSNPEEPSVEKQQELLLMNKLAAGGRLPPKTQSSFLQKKLQQRKFFDSGDYAMNQDREKKTQRQLFAKTVNEGNKPVPIPPKPPAPLVLREEEPPQPSQPAADSGSAESGSDEEEHLQIPRPETVPQRKASILHPSVHSKLSPQPHIHHEHVDDLSS